MPANPDISGRADEWHVISSEYPPQVGGVSDHTYQIANGLAQAGDVVHVWCPGVPAEPGDHAPVKLHRCAGTFSLVDLRRLSQALDSSPAPRRLLVQWVPHGYGCRSMNVAFSLWVLSRARAGDRVELMIHEPFLSFREGTLKQDLAAAVHRLMMMTILAGAQRVWVSTASWIPRIQPFALGRAVPFAELPLGNTVPIVHDQARVAALRHSITSNPSRLLIGHLGTYGRWVSAEVEAVMTGILERRSDVCVLLAGAGSDIARHDWSVRRPALAERISATGYLVASDLSSHLSACDVLVQPFPDGVSARRTSVVSSLAHALPVVTTDGQLTEAFWRDSGAVSLVPAGDRAKLISAVDELLLDGGHRRRIGEAARHLYKERFAVDRAVTLLRHPAVVH